MTKISKTILITETPCLWQGIPLLLIRKFSFSAPSDFRTTSNSWQTGYQSLSIMKNWKVRSRLSLPCTCLLMSCQGLSPHLRIPLSSRIAHKTFNLHPSLNLPKQLSSITAQFKKIWSLRLGDARPTTCPHSNTKFLTQAAIPRTLCFLTLKSRTAFLLWSSKVGKQTKVKLRQEWCSQEG